MMDTLLHDLRYALRGVRRNPGFAIVAVATLALGIGTTTAAVTAISVPLTARIPVRDLDRIAALSSFDRTSGRRNVALSAADVSTLEARQTSFDGLAAWRGGGVNVGGIDEPVRVRAQFVSASMFSVMGVPPRIGRAFAPEDNAPGGAPVAILNDRFWRSRFGAAADAVGRTILIDGRDTTIVGVMPPDDYTPELLLPLTIDPASPSYYERALMVAARLRPDITLEQARAGMDTIGAQLEREAPETHRGWGIATLPYRRQFLAPGEQIAYTLIALTGLSVLFIGCANIASLLLARGASRAGEIAVRAALGASRARLVRQMMIESLVLAGAGGVLGYLAASAGLRALTAKVFATGLPSNAADRPDVGMYILTIALAASLGSTIVFGLMPALRIGRLRSGGLNTGLRTMSGPTGRVRSLLVGGQVGVAVVLLATATLCVRSLVNLQSVESGFDTRNLLLMRVALPESAYATGESTTSFYASVRARLASAPGITAVGATERVPVEGGLNPDRTLEIEGRPALNGETKVVDDVIVTPGYLEVLGVSLRAGRLLAASDSARAPLVAVISETTARRYFGSASPLGARMRVGDEASADAWRTVVGVVSDVRDDSIGVAPPPIVYVPDAQRPSPRMTFLIRTPDDPLLYAATARAAVAEVDPDLPVYDIESMDQLLFEDLQGATVLSSMTGVFAGLALTLAAIGIYGMLAFAVARRTHELAIRVAVGAQARDIVRAVLARGLRPVVFGMLFGLAAALGAARLMSVLLFDVQPTDPSTYAFVSAVLLGATLLACLVPARRVLRLDPLAALRQE